MSKNHPVWRIYAPSTIVSLVLITYAGFQSGLTGLFLVLALVALEVSLSFDNAVVNARILKRMSENWQKAFLTVGIIIAVFGVRIILPIVLVAAAIGGSFSSVLDLALNNPSEYGHKLEEAHVLIASFGGFFLLMIFLDFFFEDRKFKWIPWLETKLVQIGSLKNASPIIAIIAMLGAIQLVPADEQRTVLTAGLAGLLTYLIIHAVDTALQKAGVESRIGNATTATFKAGLIGFIYLEVIDASFSLDGVIGAFAITNQVLLIAIGLGVGAIYVRTITVHMLRKGVLDTYRYIEHGAHYAIGILALIMITSLKFEIPEAITGLAGLTVIVISVIHSQIANKRHGIVK